MALHVLQKHSWSHSPSQQRSQGMLEWGGRWQQNASAGVKGNPHLVHTGHGAICYSRRSHAIKYEMITGHFTAQGCLYGWNSVVVSENCFPCSDKAFMGMRLKKNISYKCLPVRAHKQHRSSGSPPCRLPPKGFHLFMAAGWHISLP